ncbi:MAG: hypothetical protein ACF8LL_04370 [Phycisphaerales bacterium]
MSLDAQAHPALRLVNVPVDEGERTSRVSNVSRENIAAAALTTSDARWAIAAAAANAVEGGTAAIIRPERRQHLIKLATSLGLRPFDANLIIAIVQDAARSGQGPLGAHVIDRLAMIREPRHERDKAAARAALFSLLTAMALGAMLLMSMVLWVLR